MPGSKEQELAIVLKLASGTGVALAMPSTLTKEQTMKADLLQKAIDDARDAFRSKHGNCSMCASGDTPINGLHRGEHNCGNYLACSICVDAGMQKGDQCAACCRIEMEAGP